MKQAAVSGFFCFRHLICHYSLDHSPLHFQLGFATEACEIRQPVTYTSHSMGVRSRLALSYLSP
jgi:hypothetical protein